MIKNFLGSQKKALRKDGFTVKLYELSEELYRIDAYNIGFIPNLVIVAKDKTEIPVSFAEPPKIEFLKKGTDFDYFVDIEFESGTLYVTTFSCFRYKLDIPSGQLHFSKEVG
nr:hypothetical protein [Nitrosomonas nitrosa]